MTKEQMVESHFFSSLSSCETCGQISKYKNSNTVQPLMSSICCTNETFLEYKKLYTERDISRMTEIHFLIMSSNANFVRFCYRSHAILTHLCWHFSKIVVIIRSFIHANTAISNIHKERLIHMSITIRSISV